VIGDIKIAMNSDGAGNLRRFSPLRSPSGEKYERFNHSDNEDEMQNDVFNIPPKKAPHERLKKWRVSIVSLYIFLSLEAG
jgi:hypothetical protein